MPPETQKIAKISESRMREAVEFFGGAPVEFPPVGQDRYLGPHLQGAHILGNI